MGRWDNVRLETYLAEFEDTAERSQKEKDIIAAALKLFSEKGFDRTSTNELAKQAKVSERTLFKYFVSKNDLLKRVVIPIILKFLVPRQVQQMKRAIAGPITNAEDLFKSFASDRIQAVSHNAPAVRILLSEVVGDASFREQFAALWKKHLWKDFETAIDHLKKENQIRPELDLLVVFRTMVSLTLGMVVPLLLLDSKVSQSDIDLIAGIFARGVSSSK